MSERRDVRLAEWDQVENEVPSSGRDGIFNNSTFPKTDLWRGDGFVAYRVSQDEFAIRVRDPAKNFGVGRVVEMRKNGVSIVCEVIAFSLNNTDEVKSTNCGLAAMTLRYVRRGDNRGGGDRESENASFSELTSSRFGKFVVQEQPRYGLTTDMQNRYSGYQEHARSFHTRPKQSSMNARYKTFRHRKPAPQFDDLN